MMHNATTYEDLPDQRIDELIRVKAEQLADLNCLEFNALIQSAKNDLNIMRNYQGSTEEFVDISERIGCSLSELVEVLSPDAAKQLLVAAMSTKIEARDNVIVNRKSYDQADEMIRACCRMYNFRTNEIERKIKRLKESLT